jgi:hypothetical protein
VKSLSDLEKSLSDLENFLSHLETSPTRLENSPNRLETALNRYFHMRNESRKRSTSRPETQASSPLAYTWYSRVPARKTRPR